MKYLSVMQIHFFLPDILAFSLLVYIAKTNKELKLCSPNLIKIPARKLKNIADVTKT